MNNVTYTCESESHENYRKQRLTAEVLPKIQSDIGKVVQVLIPFISELRERASILPGKGLFGAPAPFPELRVGGLTRALRIASQKMEGISVELNCDESVVDATYAQVVNELNYILDVYRMIVVRQNLGGIVKAHDVEHLHMASEKALRELVRKLRRLNHSDF